MNFKNSIVSEIFLYRETRETMNQVTAVQFLTDLAENKIVFNICDLAYDDAKEVKIRNKKHANKGTSVSETEILFGTLASSTLHSELPIAVKLFFDIDEPDILGLKYEAKLYKKIYDDIIVPNYSPNFVSYIGYAECDKDSAYLDINTVHHNFRKKYGRILPPTICVLITERVGSGTYFGCENAINVSPLGEIWDKLTNQQSTEVMFQIVYGLVLMGLFRIMHNDLHYLNVLIAEFKKPIKLGFVVDNKMFMLKTKFIPYLFDWDFGFAESLGDNPKIENYDDLNIKNRYSEKVDMYTLFCTLIEALNDRNYGQGMSHMKEKNVTIPISDEEYKAIKSYAPYSESIHFNAPIMYKFGPVQMYEVFKNNPILKREKITGAIFMLHPPPHRKITLYNPFACRPTGINLDFPTPMEMLMSDRFVKFRVNDISSINRKYVYVLPRIMVPKRIFIDPNLSINSRATMERLGIKPRFKKAPSGYVKIKGRRSPRLSPLREVPDEKSDSILSVKKTDDKIYPLSKQEYPLSKQEYIMLIEEFGNNIGASNYEVPDEKSE